MATSYVSSIARRWLALLALGAASLPGCTVVKPVVCTFSSPWYLIESTTESRDLDDGEAEAAEAESIPTPCFCVAAPIVLPIRIVERMVNGFVGGLCTGVVSDLNVLVGNSEKPTKNVTRAWQTNAKTPAETDG